MTRIFRANNLMGLNAAVSLNLWTEITIKTLSLMKVPLESIEEPIIERNQQARSVEFPSGQITATSEETRTKKPVVKRKLAIAVEESMQAEGESIDETVIP